MVEFISILQAALLARIEVAEADDAAMADLEAELKLKRDEHDDKYLALDQKRVRVWHRRRRRPRLRQRQPALRSNGLRP